MKIRAWRWGRKLSPKYFPLLFALLIPSCQTTVSEKSVVYTKNTYENRLARIQKKASSQSLSDADLTELFLVANVLTSQKRLEEAEQLYEAVFNAAPSVIVGLKLARVKRLVGQEEASIQIIKKTELLFPKQYEPPLELASIYALQKNFSQALLQLESAYKRLPDSEEIALAYADILIELKQRARAKSVLSTALKKNPTADILLLRSARLKAEEKDYKGAKNDLNILMRTSPENIETWTLAGMVAAEEKNYKAAETYFREAFERRPENNTLARYFVLQLIKQEKYTEARRILIKLEQTSDENTSGFDAELKYQFAFVLLQLEEYKEARDRFASLMTEADDPGRLLFYIGQCNEMLNLAQEAMSDYKKIGISSSFYPIAQQRLFVLELDSGLMDAAKNRLQLLSQKTPESENDFRFFANAYAKTGSHKKAYSVLKAALKKHPKSQTLLYLQAAYTEFVDSKSASLRELEMFIKKFPNYTQALNHLGYALAEQKSRLPFAEQLLRKAVSREPKNGFYMDSLGWALYQQGKYSEAETYLLRALEAENEEPIILEHLGELKFAQKNYPQALKYFEKAANIFAQKPSWRIENDAEWKASSINVNKRIQELRDMALPVNRS